MANVTDIKFRDLPEREGKAILELRTIRRNLDKRRNSLSDPEKRNLERIEALLGYVPPWKAGGAAARRAAQRFTVPPLPDQERFDPIFIGVRDAFKRVSKRDIPNHKDGNLDPNVNLQFEDVAKVSLIVGLLELDCVEPPPVKRDDKAKAGLRVASDTDHEDYPEFVKTYWAAAGEVDSVLPLAMLTLSWLEGLGDNDPDAKNPAGVVSCLEFAKVIRDLRKKDITDKTPQLERRIRECLNSIQNVGEGRPLTDTALDLPDLLQTSDYQIQADNVRNIGAVIMTAMMEDLRVFQVVDRLIEMSQNGMLAIGGSDAGELLYTWWKETPNRMSEMERKNFYATTIGQPGGDSNGRTNRDFNDLWIRFVSSVSALVRQKSVDKLMQQSIPSAIHQQKVRKAARDLAMNLSAHGYGMAYYTARDLRNEIKKIIDLLGHPDIRGAFGARDMWQVIDQVAELELGGAKSSARYRTLATCGAIITSWLAGKVVDLNRSTSRPIIDIVSVLSDDPPSAGDEATKHPEDYDLVNACELWLADTATSEEHVEQLSREPREAPAMSSKPIQIPAIAREYLQQAGLPGLGLGMGMRR